MRRRKINWRRFHKLPVSTKPLITEGEPLDWEAMTPAEREAERAAWELLLGHNIKTKEQMAYET